jgi:hypothetical protein
MSVTRSDIFKIFYVKNIKVFLFDHKKDICVTLCNILNLCLNPIHRLYYIHTYIYISICISIGLFTGLKLG